jgi:long-subunit acyl-CoA synthetase (AMP-forming)
MSPATLASLLDVLGADASPIVRSRHQGAWDAQGARFGGEVLGLAAALSGYGLAPGACAAVIGSEGRGTLCAGLAVIAAGATLVPIDVSLSDDALRTALVSTGAVHALASNERQLARVLALRPELSALELVLLMSAEDSERKPAALLAETAMRVGAASLVVDPGGLRRALAEGEGGTACHVVDAVGGIRPVGRASLLAMANAITEAVALERDMSVLVALPVGGVERLAASLAALCRGATLLLSDPSERPDAGLGQQPADRILLNLAGITRLHRAWVEDIDAKSWIGRTSVRWALRQAASSAASGWRQRVADQLVLRGLREKLGGRAAAIDVFVGHEPRPSTEIESFFASAGLSLRYFSSGTAARLAR